MRFFTWSARHWIALVAFLLATGLAIGNARDLLWWVSDSPPMLVQEWLVFVGAFCAALIGIAAVIRLLWNNAVEPIKTYFREQFDEQRQAVASAKADRERLEAVVKAVERSVIPNGSEDVLPEELQGLALRPLIATIYTRLADHLDMAEPLMEQFRTEHRADGQ